MEPAGRFTCQSQMRIIALLLLLPILLASGACSSPSYPRYQPIATGGFKLSPQQGYSDYQIDERTYLITYQGFNSNATWSWKSLSHEKWIELAHDYVLYRSAELARSKGAKQFVIIQRDDSNQSWRVSVHGRHGSREFIQGYIPSARALIRLIFDDGSPVLGPEYSAQDVDTLMTRLIRRSAELAKQQGENSSIDDATANGDGFVRWRVPVLLDDPALEPSLAKRKSSLLDTDITDESFGVFGVVLWSRLPLSPIDLLRQCIKISDREGAPVFKLEDWTTHEYRFGRSWNDWNDWNAWFRTKARLVLLQQSEPNSLDPVFVVNEIRKNVMR